ncbi:acetate--CoA ligase family protein [Kribbella speibonae]|nr:acetate--CoA ligase family protein [Kribbella speibonae]
MIRALRSALRPRSVAVVGASSREDRYGSSLAYSIIEGGYAGELHLVGSSGGTYRGHEILPSLSAIGSPVDLVLVAVRADVCPAIVAEAGELGAGCAVILANGFAEAGNVELSDELLARATDSGMTVIGPNTMGIYSAPASLNAMGEGIPSGRVAVVSQSGAVGMAIYEALRVCDLGLSCFVSLGNQLMVRAAHVLDYLAEDPEVDSVLVYLEGMAEPAEFLDAAGRLAREKPVAVLRGGVTDAGARAAASHTGAMASDDAVISAGLRAAGVIDARSMRELIVVAQAFSGQPLAQGKRLGILTESGGYSVMGADAAVRAGLSLEPHSPEIQSALREVVLPQASVVNPVDFVGVNSPDVLPRTIEISLQSPDVDAVVYPGAFGGPEHLEDQLTWAKQMVAARDAAGKPLVLQTYFPYSGAESLAYLRAHNVPVIELIEDALAVFVYQADRNALHGQGRTGWVERSASAASQVGRTLREDAARAWFDARVDIGLPQALVVASEDEALAARADFTASQLVMKVLSDPVSHKSDVGGVVVGIESAEDMRAAWKRMAAICADHGTEAAALVTPFVYPAVEALVGALKNSPLGPLVMVGAGGVYAEDIGDRAILFPPFQRADIEEAIDRLGVLGSIVNSRRAAPAIRDHLIELVAKVGELVLGSDDLLELDLNPVVLAASGPSILDVRVTLREVTEPG